MRRPIYLYALLGFLIIFIWFVILSLPDKKLRIVACDVGQGDGLLIIQGTTQVVVDGGPNNNILTCLGMHMPFWDRQIEAIIVTNPDRDHYFGFIELTNRYKINNFISPDVAKSDSTYQKLLTNVKNNNIKSSHLYAGDILRSGSLQFDINWPTLEMTQSTQDINPLSLVFTLSHNKFKALFTGDIQPPGVDPLILTGKVKDVDLLKVPHHGSKNGLTQELLQASTPEVAIISSGESNQWGHPNSETLDILNSGNVKTYRTDQFGEIEIIVSDLGYQIAP